MLPALPGFGGGAPSPVIGGGSRVATVTTSFGIAIGGGAPPPGGNGVGEPTLTPPPATRGRAVGAVVAWTADVGLAAGFSADFCTGVAGGGVAVACWQAVTSRSVVAIRIAASRPTERSIAARFGQRR
jgi:hypothetical protein